MAERTNGESSPPVSEGDLPVVESPPLSPAGYVTESTTDSAAETPAPAEAVPSQPRAHLKLRHKRQILLAASVALAAGLGALFGSLASGTWAPPSRNVAGLEERKAMQQSIAHLTKQVALLRANLEKTNRAEHAEIAKISAQLDQRTASDITGALPKAASAVPLPRPAPHIAAADNRPTVVSDWTVRDVRDGYVYVQGHGEIYQVVPGAPLPGLGPVQSIKRQNGRWVVATPRGIIVSLRDRHYFE